MDRSPGSRARPALVARPSSTSHAAAPVSRWRRPTQRREVRHGTWRVARRDRAHQVHPRVRAGHPLAVPGPSAADGDLDLDRRLEAVHVRAIQETDLDESHGVAEDTQRGGGRRRRRRDLRLPPRPRLGRCPTSSPRRALAPHGHPRRRCCRATWPTSSGSWTSTAAATPRPAWTRSGAGSQRGVRRAGCTGRGDAQRGAAGDTVAGILGDGDADGPTVMLIGHMDTVFDPGTVARASVPDRWRPGARAGRLGHEGRAARGPVRDRALRELAIDGWREAAGCRSAASSTSPTPTRRSARRSARRSSARTPRTRTSHSCSRAPARTATSSAPARASWTSSCASPGVPRTPAWSPRRVARAILEAAHKIQALHALNGRWPGVTVNVGVVRGGTRPNVVPPEHDAPGRPAGRATRATSRTPRRLSATSPRHRPCPRRPATCGSWAASGRWRSWSEPSGWCTPRSGIAADLGFPLKDAATGGASDANTTSGLGVPSIDGLGPVGGNDHAPGEYLEIDSIVPRTALLAGLILSVGRDPVIRGWAEARKGR